MAGELAAYLRAGKALSHVQGLNPEFAKALTGMFAAAPDDIRKQFQINSGFRSVDHQRRLWQQALQKYGSPAAARKWVAPPGRSNHNHGLAADLRYLSPTALKWAHANAARHGLNFPLKHENWHIEPVSARKGSVQVAAPNIAAPKVAAPGAQPAAAPPEALMAALAPQAAMAAPPPVLPAASFTDLTMQAKARAQQEAEEKQRKQALFGSLFG